jgi:hypothetical protein
VGTHPTLVFTLHQNIFNNIFQGVRSVGCIFLFSKKELMGKSKVCGTLIGGSHKLEN